MALRDSNYPNRPLYPIPKELQPLSSREIRWIWTKIHTEKGKPLPFDELIDIHIIQSTVASHLSFQQNPAVMASFYINEIKKTLLPIHHFDWIDKSNPRLLLWLYEMLNIKSFEFLESTFQNPDQFLEAIIYCFDYYHPNKKEAAQYVLTLQSDWMKIFVDDPIGKWLKEDDQDQINWTWSYLLNESRILPHTSISSTSDMRPSILVSLDFFAYEHPYEKESFINRMKKAWSQYKFRNSDKAKKQRSVSMSDKTKMQLFPYYWIRFL